MRKLIKSTILILYFINVKASAQVVLNRITLPDLSTWKIIKKLDRFECYFDNRNEKTTNCSVVNKTIPIGDFYEKYTGSRELEFSQNEQLYRLAIQYSYIINFNSKTNTKQTILTDIIKYELKDQKDQLLTLDSNYQLEYITWDSVQIKNTSDSNKLIEILKKYIIETENYSLKRVIVNNRTINYDIAHYSTNKNKLVVGANYSMGLAYRNHSIKIYDQEVYDDSHLQSAQSYTKYGDRLSLEIGSVLNNRHHVYIPLFIQNSGYRTDSLPEVNWRTGRLMTNNATTSQYQFNMYGIGIGYKYVGFKKYNLLSPIFDIALHYLHLNAYRYTGNNLYKNDVDQINALYLRRDLFQVKIGLGAAFRINAHWDIHIMPNFAYMLNSVNKTTIIGTRLHNTSVQIGFNKRFNL